MNGRPRRHGRIAQEGQGLVEFTLALPIIVVLVFALFDAGRAVVFYAELTNAARVGARVAMVNQSNDASCTGPLPTFKCAAAAQTTGMGIAPASIPDLAINGTGCELMGSCSATVTLTYPYLPITPVIDGLIGPIDLQASSTMPIERQYAEP